MLPYVYQVTKYNRADRDEQVRYTGVADDHGTAETAYLEAVAAFAADTGIQRLSIREPALSHIRFGLEPPVPGHGLIGLFPEDLSGFHDGAEVSIEVGLELVRTMLRDSGASCQLEVQSRFFVHVGHDQHLYVGSSRPCEHAVARTRALGLSPERIDRSPLEVDPAEAGERRPADSAFWEQVATLVATGRAGLLEEMPVQGVSRWHRLIEGEIDEIRTRLTPRARLAVWPGLSPDLTAVLDPLPKIHLVHLVWEDQGGRIRGLITNEATPGKLAGARAALAISCFADEQPPLLAAVLPDEDGVLRARWWTDPDQEQLRSMRRDR